MKKPIVILFMFIFLAPQAVFAQTASTLQAESSAQVTATTTQDTSIQQGRVQTDSDTNTETDASKSSASSADGDPDQPIISGQVSGDSGAVGGDSEDIGTPSAKSPGTEIEDIGAPKAKPAGIEHEDIGVTSDGNNDESGDSPAGSQTAPSQIRVLLLAPSAEDNAHTHDPGITILERLRSIGIDDDEFGFVSDNKVYVRSGYLILGDIKGESSEAGKKGKVEATWNVGEGEKAGKPKEIVVVGSKTTDMYSPNLLEAVCKGQFATCEPQGAVTPEMLADFAQRTANTFSSVNEIRLEDSNLEIQGTLPFKLFGFIPMQMKQTVSVSVQQDTFAKVKVKFPWYSFLGRSDVKQSELESSVEANIMSAQASKWKAVELDASKSDSILAEDVTFNFSEVKAHLLQAMSNSLVQYNESDFNLISR